MTPPARKITAVLFLLAVSAVVALGQSKEAFRPTRAPVPAPDCHARVGYDRDMILPGYLLPTSAGPRTCIPFTTAHFQPPAGYQGDFYVSEFTDEKLRGQWEKCKTDRACYERVYKQVMARHPPNKEQLITDPHARFLLGKIDEKGSETDLASIRRPAYFARAPYNEPIAQDDAQTYMVEFTVPPDSWERRHERGTGNVYLRGWYLRGNGVDLGNHRKQRALIILCGGGGDRVTAIDDPKDVAYVIDPTTGKTIPDDNWPNATTGAKGMAVWRTLVHVMHQSGYDFLYLDRRGIGISGGISETNTLQLGHDLLQIVDNLRTGSGMRLLTPSGTLLRGRDAASALVDHPNPGLPVFLTGSSRGTMGTSWAMTINFDKDCSYDMPQITCTAPKRDPHIKGAILLADFSSGVGYLPEQTSPKDDGRGPGRDRPLFIGGIEVEHDIVFFPSSATLAGMHKWPSVFVARGLWCYADSLEGAMDSYSRVQGPKDLVVIRGPHPYETWPEVERKRVRERMLAYGRSVLLGEKDVPGRRTWSNMKELVATSSDVWEPSTVPSIQ